MTIPAIKQVIRSPAGGVAVGLIIGLMVASLASAGLNTLWVARGLIILSLAIGAAYILRSESTSKMTMREKLVALSLMSAVFLAIERTETWAQPKPKRFPVPPLMLMFKPTPVQSEPIFTQLPGLPVATSYISRPQGGYAGFAENDVDDAMLGTNRIYLQNLSNEPLSIAWGIEVRGEGQAFVLSGNGKGRWERQLNRNDWLALHDSRLRWLLSPVTLRPREAIRFERLGFVAPNADESLRELIASGAINEKYQIWLRMTNLADGTTARVELPFGQQPKKTYLSMTAWLTEVGRQQGLCVGGKTTIDDQEVACSEPDGQRARSLEITNKQLRLREPSNSIGEARRTSKE
jgi:hypothetical protein